MARSVKYNFLLNLINSLAGVLFPLVTFPYVARVLDPDGIGLVNFYHSIILYITLISALGISFYAVREISRIRDNRESLSIYATEILSMHMLLVGLGYVVVLVLCFTVERIDQDFKVFLVLSSAVFFNAIAVNWFYQAIEDFKYVTIRSLAIKCLMSVALFVFVRDKEDVLVYAIVLALADGGNGILNLLRLKKFVKLEHLKGHKLNIFRHLKPSVKLFSVIVISSLYLQMTPVLLGFMTDDTAVGYFTAASRLQNAMITIIAALGTTLIPRMSYYYGIGDHEKFIELQRKGLSTVMLITLPLVMGMLIVANDFMPLFVGEEFIPSIATIQIIVPTVFMIGVANVIGLQVLYPQGLERIIIVASAIGAGVSLLISILLIPSLQQNGAALGYLAAECTVTLSMIYLGRKFISCNFFSRDNIKTFVSVLIMSGCVLGVKYLPFEEVVVKLVVEILIGMVTFVAALLVLRNALFIDLFNSLISKLGLKKCIIQR